MGQGISLWWSEPKFRKLKPASLIGQSCDTEFCDFLLFSSSNVNSDPMKWDRTSHLSAKNSANNLILWSLIGQNLKGIFSDFENFQLRFFDISYRKLWNNHLFYTLYVRAFVFKDNNGFWLAKFRFLDFKAILSWNFDKIDFQKLPNNERLFQITHIILSNIMRVLS